MRRVLSVLLAAGLAALSGCAPAHDRMVLWKIVHGACVPHMAASGSPAPCLAVHPHAGYALLKDRDGASQVLLIPTARVTGIEDPAVRAPGAPDYLALAWANRGVAARLAGNKLGRRDLALAVNAISGRTQDQLHIHIDCVQPSVQAAVAAHEAGLDAAWRPFPVKLMGRGYLARVVSGADLTGVNPFRLLADQVPGAAQAMGQWTLVVVGARLPADGGPGFVLLAGHADPATGDRGAGERLEDHACALARGRRRASVMAGLPAPDRLAAAAATAASEACDRDHAAAGWRTGIVEMVEQTEARRWRAGLGEVAACESIVLSRIDRASVHRPRHGISVWYAEPGHPTHPAHDSHLRGSDAARAVPVAPSSRCGIAGQGRWRPKGSPGFALPDLILGVRR